jgi:hypothetical protein
MPEVIWQADNVVLYNTLLAIGLSGWVLVFVSTFLINHFDLFGLRQVWLYFRGRQYTPLSFKLSALYKLVRHPIMTGVFIGIWFTPVMTVGHLLFAVGMSAYILIGGLHTDWCLSRRERSDNNSRQPLFKLYEDHRQILSRVSQRQNYQ